MEQEDPVRMNELVSVATTQVMAKFNRHTHMHVDPQIRDRSSW